VSRRAQGDGKSTTQSQADSGYYHVWKEDLFPMRFRIVVAEDAMITMKETMYCIQIFIGNRGF